MNNFTRTNFLNAQKLVWDDSSHMLECYYNLFCDKDERTKIFITNYELIKVIKNLDSTIDMK